MLLTLFVLFIYRLFLLLTLFRRRRGLTPQIPRHHPGRERQEVHRCHHRVTAADPQTIPLRAREEGDVRLERCVLCVFALSPWSKGKESAVCPNHQQSTEEVARSRQADHIYIPPSAYFAGRFCGPIGADPALLSLKSYIFPPLLDNETAVCVSCIDGFTHQQSLETTIGFP